jgi:hypothetical protein
MVFCEINMNSKSSKVRIRYQPVYIVENELLNFHYNRCCSSRENVQFLTRLQLSLRCRCEVWVSRCVAERKKTSDQPARNMMMDWTVGNIVVILYSKHLNVFLNVSLRNWNQGWYGRSRCEKQSIQNQCGHTGNTSLV